MARGLSFYLQYALSLATERRALLACSQNQQALQIQTNPFLCFLQIRICSTVICSTALQRTPLELFQTVPEGEQLWNSSRGASVNTYLQITVL